MDKAPAASRFAGKVVTMAILFLLLAALTLTQGVSTSVSANRHEHKLDDAGQRQSLDWHVPQQRIAYVNNDGLVIEERVDEYLEASSNTPVRHIWQKAERGLSRTRKEVANGGEHENDHATDTMLAAVNSSARLKNLTNHSSHQEEEHHHGIHVASWRWDEIGIYFTFTAFIIVAGLAKVAFHHAHVISSRIPESCLLILLGTAVGGILYAAGVGLCEGMRGATRIPGCSEGDGDYFTFPTFTPKLFFLILLPPIILESSYSLYDRAFADNIGTVLFYAVIGTIINTFLIGLSLLGLANIGWIGQVMVPNEESVTWWSGTPYQLQGTDCLVFSALISAVDPVAVLAIFQEVGINKDLYFLVFGESLLNDAVTVVLYTMMVAFATMDGNVSGDQYALGFATFFTVSLGGLAIGILCGLLTALITRTTSEVRVVEPLAVFGMAYFAYLSAELFHFSGIISCIGCGLVQAHYAFGNISQKSYTTVKYFIKMLSATSDAIIFLFLGMVLVNDVHEWHTGFVLWTLLLCMVVRFIGVFLLTAIANRFRLRPVNLQEQFIMAYGGLRGAVSFSLVEMLEPSTIKPRQMFVTTTLVVILFTVFVQGGTIKLFVRLLHIQRDSKKIKYLMDEMNETLFDHLTAGIEEICGHRGSSFFRERIEYLDERYLKPIFTISSDKNSLQRLFEKLTLSEHVANMYTAADHTGITPIPSTAKMIEPEPEEEAPPPEQPPPANANVAEVSPLLPTPAPVLVEFEAPKRPKGRFPLVRQQTAPAGCLLPPSAPLQPLPLRMNQDRLAELPEFPEVQLRGKSLGRKSRPNSGESTTSSSMDPEATAHAFRKALRSTASKKYQRIYQRNNKNLIGDDDVPVELEMALMRRRLSSAPQSSFGGRPPTAASSLFNSPLSSPSSPNSPKSPGTRRQSTQCNEGSSSFPFTVNGSEVMTKTPASAIAKREGRQSISPGKVTTQPAEYYATENERQLHNKRQQRPDSLLRGAFAPLRAIAERETEQSTLKIQDIEDVDETEVFPPSQRPPSRRGSSKETGV